jgi:AcrR family transcriptional regulator
MSARKAQPAEQSEPRARLLQEAARLFTEHGFDAVTTREICAAAQLNPGAIHYHFGDKEGLYREVLRVPVQELSGLLAEVGNPELSLREALFLFLRPFLDADACDARLYAREMLDPSPAFKTMLAQDIAPHFEAVARLLARHIGVEQPDAAIQQLVYGLQAMAHDYSLSRPFMDEITPGLVQDAQSLDLICARLVDWGCVLVDYERKRRKP